MTSHVYPMHGHESWTLLIVDDGMVRYDLHRHEHGALGQLVTLLPPQVPHNGRAVTSSGFSKRVVYLDLSHLPACLIGFREKMTLREASRALHAHPAHLVRMFSREFGISPHQYMTSRRVDLARRLLPDGVPPGLTAAEAGLCDQSHLSRHFTHLPRHKPPACTPGAGRQSPGPATTNLGRRHERLVLVERVGAAEDLLAAWAGVVAGRLASGLTDAAPV